MKAHEYWNDSPLVRWQSIHVHLHTTCVSFSEVALLAFLFIFFFKKVKRSKKRFFDSHTTKPEECYEAADGKPLGRNGQEKSTSASPYAV